MAHYTRHLHVGLDRPALVLGMEGWIDVGLGGGAAIAHLLAARPTEQLAQFDVESFVDFRDRRPMVRITDGVPEPLTWPLIEMRSGQDGAGRDVLYLVGPEPDLRWPAFAAAVVELALDLDVRLAVALGAFPLPVPHTRPVRLAATATSAELAEQVGVVRGTHTLPAGIHAALAEGLGRAGVPAVSLWARVPDYLSRMPYPAASAALVEGLAEVAGLDLDATALHEAATEVRYRIDALIGSSEEQAQKLRQLEAAADAEDAPPPFDPSDLPTGDELASELERFLRGETGSGPD